MLDGMGGTDSMIGGGGNDTYYVDSTNEVVQESGSGGTDIVIASVSYNLTVSGATPSREVENLTLAAGLSNINATGNALNNVLTGNDGANVLNGMAGTDTMIGGLGNDTYYVDTTGDVVTETLANGGTDTVVTSVSFALTAIANVENLTLAGVSAINGTGNALANTGNSAANLIDGGAGNDIMSGGFGNDTYILDSSTDKVIENSGAGTDTIRVGTTFSLVTASAVERLELQGTGNFDATGNALNNQLVGNAGANTLDGGTGNDTLTGGGGNDTYLVDSMFDIVTEVSGGGIDLVNSKSTFTIGANVENLTPVGTASINGAGNASANTITDNDFVNTIDGGAGNDTIFGEGGNDVIIGGTGNDSLEGGTGADQFFFNTALNATSNVDTITDFTANSDSIRLAQSIFTALGSAGPMAFTAFTNGTAATTAAHRIIYDSATGNLFYDADGTGANAAVRFAVLANRPVLTYSDFRIVLSAPTATLLTDNGSSSTDKVTNNGTINITGLVSGATWQYTLNGGTTWTAGTGTSILLSGDGPKSVIVRQTDSAGNISANSTSLNFTLDTLAPTEAVATLALSADTGTSTTDFITKTAAQTITGTLSAALASGNVVKISLDNGVTWQNATAAVGTTTFSLSGVTLSGSNTIVARVEDVTAHRSTSLFQDFTLDTATPTQTVPTVRFSDDTGISSPDFLTKSALQTVSGTLSADIGTGDIIKVSLDNGLTWQTATTTVGSANFSLSGVVLTSSNTMIVRVEDAAGNIGTSRSQAYTLDATAPTEAVATVAFSADNGVSATDFITNIPTQTISGTLSSALTAGNLVKVSIDNGATWQTATASVGSTSYSLSGVTLSIGPNTLVVRVEDAAGNNSTPKVQPYLVEPPAPPEMVSTVEFWDDSGISLTDLITNIADQTIFGTLTAVLGAGNVVKVSVDNGLTWQTATASVGSTTFSLSGVTLSGSNTLIARVEDGSGNFSTAKTRGYVLDTTPPTELVASVAFSVDSGTSASDFVTNSPTQTITGTLNTPLASGDVVKVSLNNGLTWQTATASVGSTTFALGGATLSGSNTMIVRVEDTAGNASTARTQAYTLDTGAPVAQVATVDISNDSGSSATDLITNAASQTISGTLSSALAAGDVVKISINDGASWMTATAAVGSTTYSLSGVTFTASDTMMVRVEDVAGNFSTALNIDYILDTTVATPTLALASDSGTSATDEITKFGTVDVTGIEDGAVWQYSTNGGATWTTGIGTSFTLTGDGAKSVIVRQTDIAGNASPNSTALTFVLDTTSAAPALTLATDSGSSATDKYTNIGTVNVAGLESSATWQYSTNGGTTWTTGTSSSFALTGDGAKSVIVRQTDVAGNVSANSSAFNFTLDSTVAAPVLALASDTGASATDEITKIGTVNVSGLEAGATWQYSTNGGTSWTTGTGSSFALTGDGVKSVIVRQTDVAGNTSANSSSFGFTLDTGAVAPTLALSADSGSSSSDTITNIGTVNVAGLEGGASWQFSTDGGATWTTGSGASVTLSGDGAKSLIVRQTDAAGNTSANSSALAFSLDTTVATPTLALATDSGSSASDLITNVGTVNVSGLEAGATWQYSTNGGTTWTTGTGASFTLSGDGAKSVIVRQTDIAGNISASSATLAYTVEPNV